MLHELFLHELFTSVFMIREKSLHVLESLVQAALEGREIKSGDANMKSGAFFLPVPDPSGSNPYDTLEKDSVAVIPLIGTMLKYGSYWRYGTDYMTEILRLADSSPRIAGTVLLVNSPGGSVDSTIQLEDALRNRTKPCVALIDGECSSAALYAASFCDEIHAMNRMCEVGSIGAFAQIVDDSEANKKWGYRIIRVYPPESKYKNLEVREALKGKPERLIRESLTPYAIHFQNIIRENRRKLDTSVEGILEGRVFYACDAIKNGLADGLMNLEQAMGRVRRLAEEKKSFYLQINSITA